jgi:hypothetical protein
MTGLQEIKVAKLETMMEQNARDHNEIKASFAAFGLKLDESLERMEKKFAPMWVKDVMVWGGGIAGGFIILFMLGQLFVK